MDAAIIATNVGKTFRRYHADRPGTIQEAVASGLRRMRSVDRFWGLRDVSFTVGRGKTVGILGSNGSGKSTLLRLVGGIGRPDVGRIEVNGRIGALLDLAAGFHQDLTGRENAVLAGILNGLTRKQVLQQMDSIVAFAEIEKAMDNPIRTYSSGMQMRLAFSVAVHAEPDILLIDEVLSVGDLAFQSKCLERINQFKAAGCSILIVTHEASVVQELCDEALWLSGGQLKAQGDTMNVLREYVRHMGGEWREGTERAAETPAGEDAAGRGAPIHTLPEPETVRTERGDEVILDEVRFGSMELEIAALHVLDAAGQPAIDLAPGDPLRIEIEYSALARIVGPLFFVRILRADGLVCCDFDTEGQSLSLAAVHGPGRVILSIERLDLSEGRYTLEVGCFAREWAYAYDRRSSDGFSVVDRGNSSKAPVLKVPFKWDTDTRSSGPIGSRA